MRGSDFDDMWISRVRNLIVWVGGVEGAMEESIELVVAEEVSFAKWNEGEVVAAEDG